MDRVSSINKNLVRMNTGSVKAHIHKKIVDTLTQIIRSG